MGDLALPLCLLSLWLDTGFVFDIVISDVVNPSREGKHLGVVVTRDNLHVSYFNQ